jgi:hypothetical protein
MAINANPGFHKITLISDDGEEKARSFEIVEK